MASKEFGSSFKSSFSGFKPSFGVKRKKTEDRALETPESNLQRVLDFLGRVGAGERQALINVVKGSKSDVVGAVLNPLGNKAVLEGMAAGLKGEAKPSGSDVITAVRGKEPTSKAGKIIQTVAGIGLDVLNPADPLNKLKILGVLPGAINLAKTGKLASAAEGLIKGERSLLSLGPIRTPGFVNKATGEFLQGAGRAAMEVPGVKSVVNAFKAPLQKLKPLAAWKNWLGEKKSIRDVATVKAVQLKFQDLVKKIKADGPEKYIPAPMLTHYKAQGMDIERMAHNEIRRAGEMGKIVKQGRFIAQLKHDKKLAKIAGDKQQMKVLDTLGAVVKSTRPAFASEVNPAIKALAEPIKALNEKYGLRAKRFDFLGDLQEDFMGRSLTKEGKELTMKPSFGTGGATFKKGYEYNKKRVFPELTGEQMEETLKVPFLRETIYGGSFLNKPLTGKTTTLGKAISGQKGAPRFFNEDVFEEINKRVIGTNKAASNAMAIKSFVNTPDFAKPTVKDWGTTPSKMVDIPEQFVKYVNEGREAIQKSVKFTIQGAKNLTEVVPGKFGDGLIDGDLVKKMGDSVILIDSPASSLYMTGPHQELNPLIAVATWLNNLHPKYAVSSIKNYSEKEMLRYLKEMNRPKVFQEAQKKVVPNIKELKLDPHSLEQEVTEKLSKYMDDNHFVGANIKLNGPTGKTFYSHFISPSEKSMKFDKVTGVGSINVKPKNITSVAVPEDIAQEFNHFTQAITSPKELGSFLKAFDAFNSAYKTTTLYAPPAFIPTMMRNLMSDSWMSWFRGALSPSGLRDAVKLEKVFALQKKALENGTWEQELAKLPNELRVYAKFIDKSGRINTHSVYDAMRGQSENAVSKFLKSGPVTGWGAASNETASRFTRFQHFMTRIHQGYTPKAALDDTLATLYDYRYGLSDFENQVMRRLAPFYAWTRFNLPGMLKNAMKEPGRAAIIDRIKKNWESQGDKPDERTLAEYLKGDLGINVSFDKDKQTGTRLRLKGVLPLADIEDISSPGKFGDFLLASSNPLAKAGFEEASGQSSFFKTAGGERAKIQDYEGQTGKFLGGEFSRKNINRMRQIRALNEANKALGVLTGGKAGAPQLTPAEYGIRSTGLSLVPFDIGSDTDRAKAVFKRKLHELKTGKKRQEKYGRSTAEVEQKMKELLLKSFKPGVD